MNPGAPAGTRIALAPGPGLFPRFYFDPNPF